MQQFITFEELAELTGLKVKTLRHQRFLGEGLGAIGFRVGGRILFDRREVDAYLERCKAMERRERELAT